MRIPLSWIGEFVEIAEEPAKLADDLTSAGLAVDALEKDGDDTILELDITTNRVDCMNVYGVAREVSVLYDRPLRPLAVEHGEQGASAADSLAVEIEAPELCPRFTGRILDVKVGPSPDWLRRRLEQVGVRPLQNVVDLTNYVMMEMGQPSHAFDHAKLKDGRLIVRWARAGESVVTLDGVSRELSPRIGVVADPTGPQGLAGVMGGAASEVADDTRIVVLEAAYWEPLAIRRAARALAIHTEAAHRFERGADPEGPLVAQARIAHLLEKMGAGCARPGVVDAHPAPVPRRRVELRKGRASGLLGDEVPESEARRVLLGLGFKAEKGSSTVFEVPTWRQDVSREADLIEEVGRHHGLGRVPSTLPPARSLVGLRPHQVRDRALRAFLTASGLFETITYPFVAPGEAGDQVALANPLSAEEGRLRRSLVSPGLLRALEVNLRHGLRDVRLFEVGRVFLPAAAAAPAPSEPRRLGVIVAGQAPPRHWSGAPRPADFYDLKGLLEGLFAHLGVATPKLEKGDVPEYLHPGRSAAVVWEGSRLGFVGSVHPTRAQQWELRDETLVLEIDVDPLLEAPRTAVRSRPLPRFPGVERDLSLLCDRSVPAATLVAAAGKAGGDRLEDVRIVDRYDRPPVPEGKISLSLSLRFQDPERTLTGDEVQAAVDAVVEGLRREGAEIRGG
jgi:phenylalanyl-tRNA synthetase beta chain